jgi:hypothetical protein
MVVIEPLKNCTCSVCGAEGERALTMEDDGPVCIACADAAAARLLRQERGLLVPRF